MLSNLKTDIEGLLKQVYRFSLTGLLSVLINFIIYVVSYTIFKSLIVASIFGYSLGLINSYFMGRSWVFNAARKVYFNEILMFLAIYFAGGLGMTAIIYFSDLYFSFDYRLSWFVGAAYAVANNFLGSKFLVFKNR
jgi:putative flippase GtrA